MPAPAKQPDDLPMPKARPPRAEKVIVPLTINKIKLGEYLRNIFAATVPEGVTVLDIQKGSYWVNIAKTLNVSDRIEVTCEDGSYFAELYITSKVNNVIRLVMLRSVDLTGAKTVEADEESQLEVKYRGQISKHAVQNKKTKEVIQDGFNTNEEAKAWLINHEMGMIN